MRFIPLLLLVVCGCVTDAQPDFRGVRWGSTLDQVIEAEGRAPDLTQDERVIYSMPYAGLDAALSYSITGERVYSALIAIKADDYQRIEAHLSEMYGEPSLIETGQAQAAGVVAGTFTSRTNRRTIIDHGISTNADGSRTHYVSFKMSDQ